MAKRLALFWPIIPVLAVLAFTFGPHQLSDWFWRPLFVQGCVGSNWAASPEKANWWLDQCNGAYWKRVAIRDSGWVRVN